MNYLSENPNMLSRKNPPPVNTDKKTISTEQLVEDTLREVEEMKARYWREREADVFAQIALERIRQKALKS